MDINSAVSRAKGITEQQIHDLPRYRDSDAFSDDERLVLDLAVGMTRTPADVPEETIAALRQRMTEPQIVEIVSAVAWENYRSRWNIALGMPAAGFSEGAYCAVPERP